MGAVTATVRALLEKHKVQHNTLGTAHQHGCWLARTAAVYSSHVASPPGAHAEYRQAMEITVQLFASLAEAAGTRTLQLDDLADPSGPGIWGRRCSHASPRWRRCVRR